MRQIQSHPQLVEVDPHRIKFNRQNPRQHHGLEFFRLKQSVEEVGMVQIPTVRVLPGGFYECIDGEGRVRAAQEAQLPTIWVVNFGIVHDQDALTMLQVANTVRSFTYLASCKGLANLHRQGHTTESMAKKVGVSSRTIQIDVAVGYFPDQILTMIQENIKHPNQEGYREETSSEEGHRGMQTIPWSVSTFSALLPLRTQIKERHPGDSLPLDGLYDYTEVLRAVEKIIRGEIVSHEQLHNYVERRRRELFEQRFDKELQIRLETELAQAKQAIQDSHTQQLREVQKDITQHYETQVSQLEQQLKDLEKRHREIVRQVAKRPEIVAKLEAELQRRLQETEDERLRLQKLQSQIQEEAALTQLRLQQDMRSQTEEVLKEQRSTIEKELAKVRADLEAYYAQKDHERQLQAEKSVRQSVVYGTELLARSQQWILHLISPGMIKGVAWLSDPEVMALLAQVRAVRDTLGNVEEMIIHGEPIPSAVDIDSERRPNNGYQTHH